MSSHLPPDDDQLPLTARARIDRVCLAFEDAWKAGERPRIEQYLEGTPKPERCALLRELLLMESYYRCQSGESLGPDEYHARFPDHRQVVTDVLGSLGTCPSCLTQVPASSCHCLFCGRPIGGADAASAEAAPSIQSFQEESLPPGDREFPSLAAGHGRFLPGVVVANRYRIVSLLGRGGMGEVYRADDLKLGQAVALKFLAEKLTGDSDVRELFRNEVRLARQVAHPNVCRVYDIGEVGRQQFLSMEYVHGEDLASLLRRVGRLPPDRGLTVARQLAAGLAAAHDRGILHRDLKPANVMLDGRGQVRITDFGLACLSETAADERFLAGTPLYMAPEQLAGEPVTAGSDIYSLGLVLYEVFTGQQPFKADSLPELAQVRKSEPVVPASAVVEGVDPAIDRVILRCLEADRKDRPPSALAVLAALPGDDPLEAALAKGETPSPEMVAAAKGQSRGLRPASGVLCLIGVLLALAAVVWLSDKTTLVGRTQMKDPDVLADAALQVIRQHGYKGPVRDRAYGFAYENGRPEAAPIFFWYRQSPSVLVPRLFAGSFAAKGDGTVSLEDPPPSVPGEASVRLDPQGELIELLAIRSPDGGRPVSFRVAPHRQRDRQPGRSGRLPAAYAYVKTALFLLLMGGAALLARHNLCRGRGDRRGAFRLACYVFAVYALSWLLLTGRAAKPPSWSAFIMGVEISVFVSLVLWLFYIALEPYVRRTWPETLVSWNRLLSGRFRDPLVGRDLLVGVLFGVGTRLLWQIGILAPSWCGLGPARLLGPHQTYLGVPLRLLLGGRYCLGELLHFQVTAIAGGLSVLLLMLLLRFVLRKQSLAAGTYVLYGAVVLSMGVGHPYVSWLIGALAATLVLLLLIRFGLLAIVGYTYVRLLLTFPITSDLSAWYAGSATLLPLGVIVALAGYSFYLSTAGRPLIRDSLD